MDIRNQLLQRAIELPVAVCRDDDNDDAPKRIAGIGAVFYNENEPGTEYEILFTTEKGIPFRI